MPSNVDLAYSEGRIAPGTFEWIVSVAGTLQYLTPSGVGDRQGQSIKPAEKFLGVAYILHLFAHLEKLL